MRYSTNLLYRWMRALGTSDATPDQLTVEVPPVLNPVAIVPGPLRPGSAISATDIQRESFAFVLSTTQAASQAQTTASACNLAAGLWLIVVSFMYHADFTSAPGAVGGRAELTDDAGNNNPFIRFPNIANVSQQRTVVFPLMVPLDGYEIGQTVGATGAGQTSQATIDGFALRLN